MIQPRGSEEQENSDKDCLGLFQEIFFLFLLDEVKYNSNSKDNPLIPFYTSVQWNMFGSHIPYLPAKQRIIHWKMPRLQRMTDCRAFPWFLEDSVTKDMGVVEYSRLFNYLGRN